MLRPFLPALALSVLVAVPGHGQGVGRDTTKALDDQLTELAAQLSAQLTARKAQVVAVLPLSNPAFDPGFSRYVASQIAEHFTSTGTIKVVTRTQLAEALRDEYHRWVSNGFDPPNFAEKLPISGADSIVTGDFTVFTNHVRVSAKLVESKTGLMIGARSADLPRTQDVNQLLKEAGKPTQITSSIPTQQTPPAAAQNSVVEVVMGGISFRLTQCQHNSAQIVCDFTATALQRDTSINLYLSPRGGKSCQLISDTGSEHLADSVLVAGKQPDISRVLLVSGVSNKGQVTFNGIAQRPAKIALLRLQGFYHNGQRADYFAVDFRDVVPR
jgi:TolB-like protein